MVGKDWTLNMMGVRLSENQMHNIPHAKSELTLHVTTKTVQAGGLLGAAMVGPVMALARGPRDTQGLKSWAEHCGRYGVMIGLVAGPLMTYATMKKQSHDAIWDRCYRLRYNRNQVRVDRLSFVGAVAGYAAASYLGDSTALGAIVGMNGGLILAAVLNATLV